MSEWSSRGALIRATLVWNRKSLSLLPLGEHKEEEEEEEGNLSQLEVAESLQ